MSKGIYAALSGAVAQGTTLDLVAQNLAHASTTGYRSSRPVFREVLARAAAPRAAARPLGDVRAVVVQSSVLDASPGAVRATGNGLDVALPAASFLAVDTPRGERYTRAGAISMAADGTLTVASQPLVAEGGGPIRIPADAQATIDEEGRVLANGSEVGRLRIVRFDAAERLTAEGGTLLASNDGSGPATTSTDKLLPGHLEDSNASPVGAMTELVQATRYFEAFERAISAFHDADRKAASQVMAAR